MWKPIQQAPKDGSLIWVGNSQTKEMRLARWHKHAGIPSARDGAWFDIVLSETVPQPVRFDADCFAEIPLPPDMGLEEETNSR
jgi:hypothetical protein